MLKRAARVNLPLFSNVSQPEGSFLFFTILYLRKIYVNFVLILELLYETT